MNWTWRKWTAFIFLIACVRFIFKIIDAISDAMAAHTSIWTNKTVTMLVATLVLLPVSLVLLAQDRKLRQKKPRE